MPKPKVRVVHHHHTARKGRYYRDRKEIIIHKNHYHRPPVESAGCLVLLPFVLLLAPFAFAWCLIFGDEDKT